MISGTRKEFVAVLRCLDLLAELLTFSNRSESHKLTDDTVVFFSGYSRETNVQKTFYDQDE